MEEEEEEFMESVTPEGDEEREEQAIEEHSSAGVGNFGSEATTPFTEQDESEDTEKASAEDEEKEESSQDILDIDLNFGDMELEFEEVLEELSLDPQLERFRIEYGKLHSALQRSHHNERCLMDKYRELQADIAAHSAEVATALKLAAEDKQTIDALKREVEKAWKMVDLAHEREQEAKETMESLQGEIGRLHELAGQGEQISNEQQEAMDELTDTRAEVMRERNELLAEVNKLREQLERLMTSQDNNDKLRQDTDAKLQNMTQEMQVYRSDLQRESRRKERAERDLKAARADIEAKQAELRQYQTQLGQNQEQMEKANAVLKEQKAMNEAAIREAEQVTEQHERLKQDYEAALLNMDQLTQENRRRATEMKEREEEMTALHQEVLRLTKLRDTMTRKLRSAEELQGQAETQQEMALATVRRLEHELEDTHHQMDADTKATEELRHERELLKKGILKSQDVCKIQENTLRLHDQAKKQLEQETGKLRHAILKQKFIIAQLQRDRDKFIHEAGKLTEHNEALVEDIKLKELEIFDFKKRVAESDSRLKQQQSLYEAVRSDRNLYSKNLIESQNEVSEMKRKFKIIMHQIDQLKEETAAREMLLSKEQLALLQVQKDREALILDLEQQRASAVNMKARIAGMEMEHHKLTKVLADGDAERSRQRKDISQIMTERDILGTQLVRRNDELALLYEKIRIQQSTLSKGEQQYRERINDIRLLKLEIKKLR
ncbi:cilia- and flagella-associated protein 58-like [Pollicipes pollicipes]|uniref:cilia- and flagella-associated protein 58-like n=1 Tax=Pollicipes pollicipes TaxID=41117 RepID=UPI001884C5B5|nr:cilia- and flagella-associated protein 58-like [Pollicipes pollicipes]